MKKYIQITATLLSACGWLLTTTQAVAQTPACQVELTNWLGHQDSAVVADPLYGLVFRYWSKNRLYSYRALYLNAQSDTLSDALVHIQPTEQVWSVDEKQTLAQFHLDYTLEDSLNHAPRIPAGVARPWQISYSEGVLQNREKIWMHPVRFNQYVATEVAPFPEIRFRLKPGDSWTGSLKIMEGWAEYQGTVQYQYMLMPDEIREYSFATVRCRKVFATGKHDTLGSSTATFYFNPQFGFTEMHYHFYDGCTLHFIPQEIRWRLHE